MIRRRPLLLGTIGLGLGLGVLGRAAAQPFRYPPVPPPRVEPVPRRPPPGRVRWQPGHWHWSGRGYVWVPGRWVPVGRGRWAAGRWAWRRGAWVWVPGGWY
jgi:hypothetical protein